MTRESAWVSETQNVQKRIDFSLTEKIVKDVYGAKYQFLSDEALKHISDTNYYYGYYDLQNQYWRS